MMAKIFPYSGRILAMVGSHKVLTAVLLCFMSLQVTAQMDGTMKHRFTIYGGVGPNYYFNNLAIFKNNVNELNYSFVGRIMWEPEHRLSLGIETGYYRLYTLNFNGPAQSRVVNSAVPIQVVIGMRIHKVFYTNLSMGLSILTNDVTTNFTGDFDAKAVSAADFTLTLGYKKMLGERFSLGAETKVFYSSHAVDGNVALAFVAGYSIAKHR
jgi:hypothetical protein